jgi:hypothetical protein
VISNAQMCWSWPLERVFNTVTARVSAERPRT